MKSEPTLLKSILYTSFSGRELNSLASEHTMLRWRIGIGGGKSALKVDEEELVLCRCSELEVASEEDRGNTLTQRVAIAL